MGHLRRPARRSPDFPPSQGDQVPPRLPAGRVGACAPARLRGPAGRRDASRLYAGTYSLRGPCKGKHNLAYVRYCMHNAENTRSMALCLS